MAAAEDDDGFTGVYQFGEHGFERGVCVCLGAAGKEVSGVGDAKVAVPEEEAIEFFADDIWRGGIGIAFSVAALVACAEEDDIGGIEVGHVSFFVAIDQVADLEVFVFFIFVQFRFGNGGQVILQVRKVYHHNGYYLCANLQQEFYKSCGGAVHYMNGMGRTGSRRAGGPEK